MVIRVWERIRRVRGVAKVVIATPDLEIMEAAKRFGAEAVLTSGRCRSGSDRAAEAARGLRAGVIVNVQGDEPFISPASVTKVIAALMNSRGSVMSTLRCPMASRDEWEDPGVVKVLTGRDGAAICFSRRPLPYDVSGGSVAFPSGESDPWGRHVGIYAFRRGFLLKFAAMKRTPLEAAESLEQLRALENGFSIQVGYVRGAGVGVDTPADLEKARGLFRKA